jgi:predicted Fe-Mo cluster-binding NifX family protein
VIVAIPVFDDAIAPCFEAASRFIVYHVQADRIESEKVEQADGCDGFGRVHLLRKVKADVLICSGIKAFYRDMLTSTGMRVIAGISEPYRQALSRFLSGNLQDVSTAHPSCPAGHDIPLRDLICWTKDLFKSHGYKVTIAMNTSPFPIDLIAEINCPRCGKPVRVAICCGAHSYRADQEIREFNLVTGGDYHARVYVHPRNRYAEDYCRQYNIELIDPDRDFYQPSDTPPDRLPVIKQVVTGHELASGAQKEEM